MYWWVVIPTWTRELGYRKNCFGPYNYEQQAQALVDKMEMPADIIELPTDNRDEAVSILSGEGD